MPGIEQDVLALQRFMDKHFARVDAKLQELNERLESLENELQALQAWLEDRKEPS